MWRSATSSDRPVSSRQRAVVWRPRLAAWLVILGTVTVAQPSVLISIDDALASAFPNADATRQTVFLTTTQLEEVEDATGKRPSSALVTRFQLVSDGETIGWAYLDTHRVRTLPETVLVSIDGAGSVLRVEVVAFREPLDYLPPDSWYGQFNGHGLGEELELKRAIRPIIGATLTARATTSAVRRILAIHEALSPVEATP